MATMWRDVTTCVSPWPSGMSAGPILHSGSAGLCLIPTTGSVIWSRASWGKKWLGCQAYELRGKHAKVESKSGPSSRHRIPYDMLIVVCHMSALCWVLAVACGFLSALCWVLAVACGYLSALCSVLVVACGYLSSLCWVLVVACGYLSVLCWVLVAACGSVACILCTRAVGCLGGTRP